MRTVWAGVLSGVVALAASSHAAAPVVTSLGAYSQDLKAPARVAADAAGNLYVSDPAAGTVVVFDAFGRHCATRTGFVRPLGIAVDAQGRIYVAEESRGRVSVFDANWNELLPLGAGDGEFQLPNHIAINPAASSNAVYVSDSKANEIKVYDGADLVCRFGASGTNTGQFDFPAGVCVSPTGEVFVVDQGNDRVQVFDLTGGCRRVFAFFRKTGLWGRKQGALVDGAGRLYVADSFAAETFQGALNAYDSATGTLLSSVGGPGGTGAPAGLALVSWGRLYAASANSGKVNLYGLDSFVHLVSEPAASAVSVGTSLVFRAVTGGAGPYAFQWMKDGNLMPDATNAEWIVASAGVGDSGGYSVVVTGPSGSCTSSVAPVAVQWRPEIFSQPQDLVVFRGESAQFIVGAWGSGLSFQWRVNGRDIDGAINSTLELPQAEAVDNGTYSVLVRNAVGSATSADADLTVLVPPLVTEILSGAPMGDQFRLTINVDPGYTFMFEASTNLLQWDALCPVEANGILDVTDADSAGFWQRYYRLRWMP